MAEDNDSNSATAQPEETATTDNNKIADAESNLDNSSSNDVELIDLSNDEEEIKEVETVATEVVAENLENGDNGVADNDNNEIDGDDEEDDDDDDDDDDDEDDDDDDDDDDVQITSVNGSIEANQPNQQSSAKMPIFIDEDEIMISDGEVEDDEEPVPVSAVEDVEDVDDDEEDDDDDDEEEEEEEEEDSGSLILENEIIPTEKSVDGNSTPVQPMQVNKSHRNAETNHEVQPRKSLNNDSKEEIIIDDDDDDDVMVQDLSTKSQNNNSTAETSKTMLQNSTTTASKIEDLVPKLSDELLGFPKYLKGVITLGECLAINKKSRSDIDIDKEYSILDCPSQVVPLIVKKSNKFPAKLKQDKEDVKPITPPSAPNQNTKNMLTISDFYSSSVGKFLIGVGLSRVKQWYHKDAINKVRKQIRKEGEAEDLMEELKKQQDYLNCCRAANASYIYPTEKCEHCDFRSEFKSVLNQHLVYPHATSRKEYKCNYCQFSTRDSKVIIDHVGFLHEKRCKVEIPPQLYECPICPYESGVKSKAATHITKCLKFFLPEKLLVNKDDYFPTITPKPITQEDIKIYEATLQALRFAALNPQTKVPQIAGLPPGLQQQMYMVQQQQLTRGLPPGRTKNKQSFDQSQSSSSSSTIVKNRPIQPAPPPVQPATAQMTVSPFNLSQLNFKGVPAPQLYQMLSSVNPPIAQFLQNPGIGYAGLQTQAGLSLINNHKPSPYLAKMNLPTQQAQQPQPPPPSHRNSMQANNVLANNRPNIISKQPTNKVDGNPKGSFVMCEICDGYIKDLDQLRTHMHWIHKVRIHPKMLASRPPLNCQKCQWRFFTDQGLERHLLGAHGLVTSNMQDMVNQCQDGGRCTICGRVFTSKMVTHMNQAHKINLKPAHLSYKCTVCSATFNLYRLFENHVYMVHSGSVKRNNNSEETANQPPRKKTALDLATAANGN